MKRIITTVASVALGLAATAPTVFAQNDSSVSDPQVNLIDEGRHMAVLNEQTFGETPYTVPSAPDGAIQFGYELKGYVFGIRLIRAHFLGYESGDRYAAYTDMKTSGLGALIKKMDIWAVTRGQITPDGALRPDFHVQQNTDKKNRRVEMVYDRAAGQVAVDIIPPLGSQGLPPASPQERFSALDTASALLHMTRQGRGDETALCQGSVPVFDSKQYYNLRLTPVGTRRVGYLGKKQEAIRCNAFYEPVSGFDPEDLPEAEEAETPIKVYFRYVPEIDRHVPVRFSYKISGFKAVIRMSEMTIITPDGTVISEDD